MSCCTESKQSPLESISPGLTALPRQVRGFAEVRRDLLRALGNDPGPLTGWNPSGNDFGLMWLEMWAYITDVLGFYDERIANETYLRTAVLRPSLRRIVGLLGYTPKSGIAASATVAALADGKVAVTLPPGTGFRSKAFGTESPQVFETTSVWTIHPLKNQWTIASFKRHPTVDVAPVVTDSGSSSKDKGGSGTSTGPNVRQLLFETAAFGLAKGQSVLLDNRQSGSNPVSPPVTLVTAVESFAGKDSVTYNRVTFQPAVTIGADVDLSTLRARVSTQTASPTTNTPIATDGTKGSPSAVENVSGATRVYFDGPPNAFRRSEPMIVAMNLGSPDIQYAATTISTVKGAAVRVTSIPAQTIQVPQPSGTAQSVTIPSPAIAGTELQLSPQLPSLFVSSPDLLTFQYNFVEAGQPTNVGKMELSASDLSDPEDVPLSGTIVPPPEATAAAQSTGVSQATNIAGVLEQEFLIADAVQNGVIADGRITFTIDGKASFQALSPNQLPATSLKLPLTIYGNVIDVTRGESVNGEVLGDGNARLANQQFKLRKKPLTYLPLASPGGDPTMLNTLQIRVNGLLWKEVTTFFASGPGDQVYTVFHDDSQNTFVTFGDGVRGARLPSGVKNVAATYRFGVGAAAPPAGSITQLAGAVKGLKSVRSPVAASSGMDPDNPDQLRTNAPRIALLFGRAVSAADFEALARQQPGVVQAKAEWLWIPAQMQAGVMVQYIGSTNSSTVADALRAQADPTIPIDVVQAQPIPATLTMGVEVDSRYVKETVATAVQASLIAPSTGVLSLQQARIGGNFWPSILYEAVAQVPGVIAVSGITVSTPAGGPLISNSTGTCIETGKYLDFSAPDSLTVTGVDPIDGAQGQP